MASKQVEVVFNVALRDAPGTEGGAEYVDWEWVLRSIENRLRLCGWTGDILYADSTEIA